MMIESLRAGLSSRNGLVRKGTAALLLAPKAIRWLTACPQDYEATPIALANSFPKSGTHLLVQILNGLPSRVNYGAFLGSHISSLRFRERSAGSVSRFIRCMVPGEVVRGHLVYDPRYAKELAERGVVHYFVYRDPRDVVVSDAHYLRELNRWHRLHPFFRKLDSIEAAIRLAITGLDPPVPGIDYPNIAERFARYRAWLDCDNCLAVRYEDLMSEQRPEIVHEMARFYVQRSAEECNVDLCVRNMLASVAPRKSHTFRSGKKGGWQAEFTAEHRRLFDDVAGDLLVKLGYEAGHTAVDDRPPALAHAHV
jgi:hypothetical protein